MLPAIYMPPLIYPASPSWYPGQLVLARDLNDLNDRTGVKTGYAHDYAIHGP